MLPYIAANITGLLVLQNQFGNLDGQDWYRSLSCLSLVIWGTYASLSQYQSWYHMNSMNMYSSYMIVDIYEMIRSENKRYELWYHHLMTISAHFWLRSLKPVSLDGSAFQNIFISKNQTKLLSSITPIVYLGETLSVFNSILRQRSPTLLKYWRLFTIVCIRLPLWLLVIYQLIKTQKYAKYKHMQNLYISFAITLPGIDMFFLRSIYKSW